MLRELQRPGESHRGVSRIEDLQAAVRAMLGLRTRRGRHFGADLFGEPAWDILLLLASQSANTGCSIAEIAEAFGYVPSVVERWLGILENKGQVYPDDTQHGLTFQLTGQARQSLADVLLEPI